MVAGDKNTQYLGRDHLEQSLAEMLAEMPEDRRERCRAGRPGQEDLGAAGLHLGQLGAQVAVARRTRDLDYDEATMDEEPTEF
jgi:hypothetical protein